MPYSGTTYNDYNSTGPASMNLVSGGNTNWPSTTPTSGGRVKGKGSGKSGRDSASAPTPVRPPAQSPPGLVDPFISPDLLGGIGSFFGKGLAILGLKGLGKKGAKEVAESLTVDANKLSHIFAPKHGLDNLVELFGSQGNAFAAIQKATEQAVRSKGLTGIFETSVRIGTELITVRGNVVDGVVKIGTAFKPFK